MNLLTLKLTLAHCEVHRHIDKTPEWDTPVHDDSEYWFWISAESLYISRTGRIYFAPAVEYHFTGHVSYELDSPVGESSPIQLKSQ